MFKRRQRTIVYIHSCLPLCILQHAKFLVSLATVVALELILRDSKFTRQATFHFQRTTPKLDAAAKYAGGTSSAAGHAQNDASG